MLTTADNVLGALVGQQLIWARQRGTGSAEGGHAVVADSFGGTFVAGVGYGDGFGNTFFVSKWDQAGNVLWEHQFSARNGSEISLAPDSQGGVYVTGTMSEGGLFVDAYLRRYHTHGTMLWHKTFGTSQRNDYGFAVAADAAGNAYIAGASSTSTDPFLDRQRNAFVTRFDLAGNRQWSRQFPDPSYDRPVAVAVDQSGGVYTAGSTRGEMFLVKHNVLGAFQWGRHLGSNEFELTTDVATDAFGNAYLSGATEGALAGTPMGGWDAVLAKYDTNGSLVWQQQSGTAADDMYFSVDVDPQGNPHGTGRRDGDILLEMWNPVGEKLARRLYLPGDYTNAYAMDVSPVGEILITGQTNGEIGGPQVGSGDVFLMKLRAIPEPSTLVLSLVTLSAVTAFAPRRARNAK
jgi:hypothetical protein